MHALFVGQSYIDITLQTDIIPTGDEKAVAKAYAVSFGGNAVTAAFCCAKLGIVPDLLCSLANDWLGRMFMDMAAQYKLHLHARPVEQSSLSFIIPKDGKRAIVRARDDNYLHPYPQLNLNGCQALHLDGHQADAALHYAKLCRESGILTSLDGGGLRSNTDEVLQYIDVAIVAERLCEQMSMTPDEMLRYLKAKGCKIGGVTMGSKGMFWYDEHGTEQHQKPLDIPSEKVIDTNGAGDIFHGSYVFSFLKAPHLPWAKHFEFARAASAHSIQHLGNEASLPAFDDIARTIQTYGEKGLV